MNERDFEFELIKAKEQIRKEIHEEVRGLFEKEKNSTQDRINLYLSVVKWVGAGFVAMLTILGISKWDDISKKVQEDFAQKLDRKFKIDDSATPFSKQMDDIKNRSLVGAIYIEAQKNKLARLDDEDAPALYSRKGEVDNLLAVVRNESTSAEVFNDAIYGLNYLASTNEMRGVISKSISELLVTTAQKKFSWMNDDDEKTIAILGFPKSPVLSEAASKLISNKRSNEVIYAALMRIEKDRYSPATQDLLRFYDETESRWLKLRAALSLVAINPDNKRVKEIVREMLIAGEKNDGAMYGMAVEAILRKIDGDREIPGNISSGTFQERMTDLVIPLIDRFVKSSAVLTYDAKSETLSYVGNNAMADSYGLIYTSWYIDPILRHASDQSVKSLLRYISKITPSNIVDQGSGVDFKVVAWCDSGSLIRTENGEIVDPTKIPNGKIELVVREPQENSRNPSFIEAVKARSSMDEYSLLALWKVNENQNQLTIGSMTGVRFSIEHNLKISQVR